MFDYDVIIIGGGVSGCACARELSRYKIKVCVLEKEEDVCSGTSKANSGMFTEVMTPNQVHSYQN